MIEFGRIGLMSMETDSSFQKLTEVGGHWKDW